MHLSDIGKIQLPTSSNKANADTIEGRPKFSFTRPSVDIFLFSIYFKIFPLLANTKLLSSTSFSPFQRQRGLLKCDSSFKGGRIMESSKGGSARVTFNVHNIAIKAGQEWSVSGRSGVRCNETGRINRTWCPAHLYRTSVRHVEMLIVLNVTQQSGKTSVDVDQRFVNPSDGTLRDGILWGRNCYFVLRYCKSRLRQMCLFTKWKELKPF